MLFCAVEGEPRLNCKFFTSLKRKCMLYDKFLRIWKSGDITFAIPCKDCEKVNKKNGDK